MAAISASGAKVGRIDADVDGGWREALKKYSVLYGLKAAAARPFRRTPYLEANSTPGLKAQDVR